MKASGIFKKSVVVIAVFAMSLSIIGCSNGNMAGMKKDTMFVGKLSQTEKYYDMHPAFEKAFKYLRETDLTKLAMGRNEIDGDKMFCLVSKGPGKKREDAKLEAHRKYIDIQYIISGTDEMGSKPTADCAEVETAYDATKDLEFFKDKAVKWTKVPAGSFAIFYPEISHAPLVSDGEIHKAVLKVLIEQK